MERLKHPVESPRYSLYLLVDLLPLCLGWLVILIRAIDLLAVSPAAEIYHELRSLWNPHISDTNVEKPRRVDFSVTVSHRMIGADADVDD